jgi:hypothetical protein
MAKRGGGSGRKYVRDNRGRFSSTGATARGGRLKTASGKKRAAQTVKAKTGGKPAGAIKGKIKRDPGAAKPTAANSARVTGKLTRPVATGNIRRTGGRLGPKNTIKPGPKSPRTKMNRAIDNVIKKGKALKGSAEKLRGVKKQADALRGRMLKEDKGRLGKALSKPSVTDKRSRDYGGRLTKGARGQDPATGGKKSSARRADRAEAKPAAAKPAAANKISRSPRQLNKDEKIARDVMTDKRFKSDRQRVTEMQRRGVKPGTDVVGLVAKARSKQGGGTTGRIKPAAAKRSGAVGKISEAKAGRIVARMDAQRGRKALPGRRNANFVRTYERSRQFILKPSTAALKKGKPISVNESVQKAVANAAKRRKAKPAAAKPAAAKTKLKRSGKKIGVGRLTTNEEQGRKGIVSMSSQAKAARKGAVAERKSAKMSRIAERQSEIVARRQGRRASNYNPDGTFNQSTANANQRRLGRSKQLQEKLSYAGGGKNIASKALSKRRTGKRRFG